MKRTANQRHYLLSEALVLDRIVDPSRFPVVIHPDFLRANPDSVLFRALGTRLDPERSRDVDLVAGFTLRDTGAEHTVIVRRGVIEYRQGRPAKAELRVTLARETWLVIAGGVLRWTEALAKGALQVTPDAGALEEFAALFDGQERPLPAAPASADGAREPLRRR